eukprot:scaffold6775_cov64-Phaeocystis_antarctica.AAC.1
MSGCFPRNLRIISRERPAHARQIRGLAFRRPSHLPTALQCPRGSRRWRASMCPSLKPRPDLGRSQWMFRPAFRPPQRHLRRW